MSKSVERYDAQVSNIMFLMEIGRLKEGLDKESARDILWTLTGREIYRMLVRERGWTKEKYKAWLAKMLAAALLSRAKVEA